MALGICAGIAMGILNGMLLSVVTGTVQGMATGIVWGINLTWLWVFVLVLSSMTGTLQGISLVLWTYLLGAGCIGWHVAGRCDRHSARHGDGHHVEH
eukprot:3390009-Ditylum_brightwellii.AAC.1